MLSRDQCATTVALTTVAGFAGACAVLMCSDPLKRRHAAFRKRLPKRIILVRHGESEANADETLYRTKPDNLVELTDKGSEQAVAAGRRLRQIIPRGDVVDFHMSPFQRTLQTARGARISFEGAIRFDHVDSQLRVQEIGNLQVDDFETLRQEQKKVGRFFYRFPTGESGADVFDRTAQWWESHFGLPAITVRGAPDTVVVFTHGLTIRLLLMQLFSWSVDTFHTVWNAGNCDIYVLTKDLSNSRHFPYRLDPAGDMPNSSRTVTAELVDGTRRELVLSNYLDIPPPRTTRSDHAARMLEEQYGFNPKSVRFVDFFHSSVTTTRPKLLKHNSF